MDARTAVSSFTKASSLTRRPASGKLSISGNGGRRETGLPLPLGGNVLRRDIPRPVQHDLLEIMRESIDYGLNHRPEAVRHSMPYARDMDTELAGKFIGMYVNDYTRDYGDTGRAAIREFLGRAVKNGLLDRKVEIEFVE